MKSGGVAFSIRFVLVGVTLLFLTSPVSAATDAVRLGGNLDASSSTTAVVPGSFASLAATANFATQFDLLDSLRSTHTVFAYFFHTASNTWTALFFVDGADVGAVAGAPVQVLTTPLTFSSTGALVAPAREVTLGAFWSNGAAGQEIPVDFFEVTQLASTSALTTILGGRTCAALSHCFDESIQSATLACVAQASSCHVSPARYPLTAESVAQRALNLGKCPLTSGGSVAKCRRCYSRASARLARVGHDQTLFGGVLAEARQVIAAQSVEICK